MAGASKRSPPGARPRRRSWRRPAESSVRQGAVLEEASRATLGHTPELFQDLEPEHGDERFAASIGQVGLPALPAAAEHAVVVDADDGPDGEALGAGKLGEGLVQIGPGEAPLGEQGLGLGTVGRVELVSPGAWVAR